MKETKGDITVAIILSIVLSYITYMFAQQELQGPLRDMNGHTYVYLTLFENDWREGWGAVPYCMWHMAVLFLKHIVYIPVDIAACIVCVFWNVLSYFITYWMLLRYTEKTGKVVDSGKAAVVSFGLMIIQPLYFSWLDVSERYIGSFSMNPLHNPTQMCMRPFALLCICLVYDIWSAIEDKQYEGTFFSTEKGLGKLYFYLTVVLLLSCFAKPTFAEMFIPAVAFIMLARWLKLIKSKSQQTKEYFGECLRMLVCAVPSLLYILLSVCAYFIWGGSYGADDGLVITSFLEVWSMFTENVGLAVLFGMAFPLFILLVNPDYFLKDNLGILALVGYGIGFLEAAFLGEGGAKLSHGDFLWPMMAGMLIMFMAATLHLLELEIVVNAIGEIGLERNLRKTKIQSCLINIGWGIFFAQVLFGMIYIKSVIAV